MKETLIGFKVFAEFPFKRSSSRWNLINPEVSRDFGGWIFLLKEDEFHLGIVNQRVSSIHSKNSIPITPEVAFNDVIESSGIEADTGRSVSQRGRSREEESLFHLLFLFLLLLLFLLHKVSSAGDTCVYQPGGSFDNSISYVTSCSSSSFYLIWCHSSFPRDSGRNPSGS